MNGTLTQEEQEALWQAHTKPGPHFDRIVAVVEGIKARATADTEARLAAAQRKADYAAELARLVDEWAARAGRSEARLAAVRAAAAMSDHEPTNRVWHEQMQRIRAALDPAPSAPDPSSE